MKTLSNYEDLIEEEKNKYTVTCQYCKSKILTPKAAQHVIIEHKLPFMTQKKDSVAQDDGEELSDFWVVNDMFTFENIGFTHTVNDIKYLSCADCEMGPIGYHTISTKLSYVALARVTHQKDEQ